jgi:hypothetical protein
LFTGSRKRLEIIFSIPVQELPEAKFPRCGGWAQRPGAGAEGISFSALMSGSERVGQACSMREIGGVGWVIESYETIIRCGGIASPSAPLIPL